MKKKLFKIFLLLLTIVLILVLIFLLLWKNDIFVLKAVRIYDNQFVTKNEILGITSFDFSEHIFNINVENMEKEILEHPMIEEVRVTRFYPSILKIRVKEHVIIAGIPGSEVAAVTEKGNVVFRFNPLVIYDLPVITGLHFITDSLGIRKPQKPELILKGVKILKSIKKNDPLIFHEISELNFSQNRGMVFFLKKNNIPVIFGEKYLVRKLNYFSTIFKELLEKNSLNSVLALDIRYDGQVVVKQR